MDERKRYEAGMSVRREVLGDEHVNRAHATETSFDADFQDLITRYAWGEIWARPGLSRHTRSLLTIALMVALNRGEELRLHLRAAANNGVSAEEIREVLMHCAIYCGVPAANAAFHAAKEILNESSR
ncbi:MAG TPA: 4-carboxymuconolactone decarboxylase [Silvibacterium sp.]|nr:4-carboxymuconolactone decarboxylase [Silvibacterium sp.]